MAAQQALRKPHMALRKASQFSHSLFFATPPRPPEIDEVAAEVEALALADAGLAADVVIVYAAEARDGVAIPKKMQRVRRASGLRSKLVSQLQRVGLTVRQQRTSDRKRLLLKITAPTERLVEEAHRLQIQMMLKPTALETQQDGPVGSKDLVFFRGFRKEQRDDFVLKDGRLFSTLERQRLIFAIIEAARNQGGCQLDLDHLEEHKIISACFPTHSEEVESLHLEWTRFRMWPCTFRGQRLRMWPDLGLLQQPLYRVRDYYGELIAFYFAWLEHQSCWLLMLLWLAVIVEAVRISQCGQVGRYLNVNNDADSLDSSSCSPVGSSMDLVYCTIITFWSTLCTHTWARRQAELKYQWNVHFFQQKEIPRAAFIRKYVSSELRARREAESQRVNQGPEPSIRYENGFYVHGLFRKRRFIKHEDAPPVLIANSKKQLKITILGSGLLLLVFVTMLIGSLAILAFRMIMTLSFRFKGGTLLNPSSAPYVGSLLSTLWISVMNLVYTSLASHVNDLENHRTQTEYDDALIIKIFFFQIANSYSALIYIAFFKTLGPSLFNAFGETNARGDPISDMCGTPGTSSQPWSATTTDCDAADCNYVFLETDCMRELRIQVFFQTVVRPLYELPLQVLLPRLRRWFNNWMRRRSMRSFEKAFSRERAHAGTVSMGAPCVSHEPQGRDTSDADDGEAFSSVDHSSAGFSTTEAGAEGVAIVQNIHQHQQMMALTASVEKQMARSAFSGTFNEYNTKVIQFGFVALFSVAFPLSALAAAIANFFELRVDAHKLSYELRRPRYRGAADIGSWQFLLSTLSWIAVITNVLIVAYTSSEFRDQCIFRLLASDGFDCKTTDDPTLWTEKARVEGTNISYLSDCVENYNVCFASIGGESWLPAFDYLLPDDTTTFEYVDHGLCNTTSPLYSLEQCSTCLYRRADTFHYLAWFVLLFEHFLVLCKLFVVFVIPRRPLWVEKALARRNFIGNTGPRQTQHSSQVRPSLVERVTRRHGGGSSAASGTSSASSTSAVDRRAELDCRTDPMWSPLWEDEDGAPLDTQVI